MLSVFIKECYLDLLMLKAKLQVYVVKSYFEGIKQPSSYCLSFSE